MVAVMCTVILILICKVLANQQKSYSCNVGTVLFSADDIMKRRWAMKEISLLLARRHFQRLLPPPAFVNTFNDDSVNVLINYFKNSYGHIKKEAKDLDTDTILTAALSDVFGGYLKQWINPYVKIGFYGGTVSEKSAVKLFLFYEEVKKYLNSDGTRWHCPDDLPLRLISIGSSNTSSTTKIDTRSMQEACDNLAYFEKTTNGFTVPLPIVHFHEVMSTMFVPLKNTSLIIISEPDHANTLLRYYDTAKHCIAASNSEEARNFDDKFQSWLRTEILPHLRDDKLYLALSNVLTLVNSTNAYGGHLIKEWTENNIRSICFAGTQPAVQPSIHCYDCYSKKVIIILAILIIEIAWCVPAFFYILCSKHKKKDNSNVYLYIDPGKPDRKDKVFPNKKPRQSKAVQYDPRMAPLKTYKDSGVQNAKPPQRHVQAITSDNNVTQAKTKLDFTTQCPSSKLLIDSGTGSRSYFKFKNRAADTSSKRHSRKKKITSVAQVIISTQNRTETESLPSQSSYEDINRPEDETECVTYTSNTELTSRRQNRNRYIKMIQADSPRYQKYSQTKIVNLQAISNNQRKIGTHKEAQKPKPSESETTTSLNQSVSQINTAECGTTKMSEPMIEILHLESAACNCTNCPCIDCLVPKPSISRQDSTPEVHNMNKKIIPTGTYSIIDEYKPVNRQILEDLKIDNVIFTSSVTAVEKVNIDRSAVDDIKQKTLPQKRSRIPKLMTTSQAAAVEMRSAKTQARVSYKPKRKSWIPQLQKKTVDDGVLLENCCCSPDVRSRLNSTF